MLDYDLFDFEIRDIPKTDGHSELILQTIAQGVTGFVIELIIHNTLLIDGAEVRKKLSTRVMKSGVPITKSVELLASEFLATVQTDLPY